MMLFSHGNFPRYKNKSAAPKPRNHVKRPVLRAVSSQKGFGQKKSSPLALRVLIKTRQN